jgi:hypothetical protein
VTPIRNHRFAETDISVGTLDDMEETTSDDNVDHSLERRSALRARHLQGLTRLMETRTDLRGVHALADFVDDAVRWTA